NLYQKCLLRKSYHPRKRIRTRKKARMASPSSLLCGAQGQSDGSQYHLAELKRKQEELAIVSAELANLSEKLNRKLEDVKERDQALNQRERDLVENEMKLAEDIKKMVNERSDLMEANLKKDVETILRKYEDTIATLSRENKRLQQASKDLVALKQTQLDLEDKTVRFSEAQHQLKLYKERTERLKSKLATPQPKQIVIERAQPSQPSGTSIEQLRKLLQARPPKKDVEH
ncbi:hypothetical protein HDV05_002856, partial [Chytridiales sp. JEL 0842]